MGVEQRDEITIKKTNAIPVIGIEPYKRYLKDLLPLIRTDCSGQISIEFIVDSDGGLANFNLLENRSDKCLEIMNGIIFDGPKWTLVDKNSPPENNVVNLTITSDIKE